MERSRKRLSPLLICLFLLVVVWLSHSLWLQWFGHVLIRDEGPRKADIAVVLAGDDFGHRIEKGGDLVRSGFVPAVLVSGPPYYHIHECDVAIAFAVIKGYPAEWFVPFPNSALSTREEAAAILPELERRGVHSFLLVTSDYHTARAARIYRAAMAGKGLDMHVIAAPDEYFREDSWWRNREGEKTVFFEWSKTIATALGR
ncbi:MAG TPA: YdcF family protein [Bryobacteraceae bacterium]|nr:YdcF family protein [Bryobacteraceae bacterium]